MSAFRFFNGPSCGASPAEGDVPHEGLLKVERREFWGFGVLGFWGFGVWFKTHCSHVCRGFCLQCLPHGASWMDANRGPGGLDPDHQGSPSSVSSMAQRTPRCFEAQSVSRFEDSGAQAAVSSEDRPSEVEDHEVRGCIEGVGARAIRSPCMSGRSSQEGQDGEFGVSRYQQPPSGGVCCGSECQNCSARGFFGSFGARRCRRTESSRGCVEKAKESPCTKR